MNKHESCIVCNSSSVGNDRRAAAHLNLPDLFKIKRCTHCNLRWLYPMPNDEEYKLFYSTKYFTDKKTSDVPEWMDYFDLPEVYEDRVANLRLNEFEERLNRLDVFFKNQGSLLDIGIATGEFMSSAKQRGWDVSGLDISDYAVERAFNKFGIQADVGDLLEKDFKGKKFDVIHLNHVFEHLLNPVASLNKISQLMHSNSLLIIEVPNQFDSSVRKTVNLIRSLYGKNQQKRSVYSIHHPFFYNAKNIQMLTLEHGFDILSVKTYFPERWGQNIARKTLKFVEYISDLAGRRGDNIEVIAKLKQK